MRTRDAATQYEAVGVRSGRGEEDHARRFEAVLILKSLSSGNTASSEPGAIRWMGHSMKSPVRRSI